MAIKFIIDSASDILPKEAEELGMIHIPLTVSFGGQAYADGADMSHREFYEKLVESAVLPTTSQIPPAVFEEAYERATANGDEVVAVTLSGRLSGTYQSAAIAAENYRGKVFTVDSENVSLGERILILRGLELREQGLSAREIMEKLNEEKHKVRVLALLDTLEYLKKGGRISKTVAFAGTVLSIKPVVTVERGEVVLVGKARGSKNGNNLLRELINKCGGVDFERPYYLAYSGLSDDMLQKYIADSADLWRSHSDCLPISTVGCAIGTHVGPGAIAVSFFENMRENEN